MARESASALRGARLRAHVREQIDAVGRADQKVQAAAKALQEAESPELRGALVEMSLAAPQEVAQAFLHAALRSGDAVLARSAAESLVYLSGPGCLPLIEECLQMADPLVRQRGVEALEDQSGVRALSLLATGLGDSDEGVRRAATACLELIVGSRYLPLRDPALEALGDQQSELFATIVGNDDPLVKRQLAQAMAYAASDRVLKLLSALSGDDDFLVRQEAVLALASIGTPAAVRIAASRIEDANYVVAAGILDVLAPKFGSSSGELLECLKICMHHQLAEVRRDAVLMLDKFPPEQVRDLLIETTRDSDFEVAQRAGEILRKMFPSEGLDWLGDEVKAQSEDGRTYAIWEAGNIAQETGSRALGQGDAGRVEDIVQVLEAAAMQGSSAMKINAISELSILTDIADSRALQEALTDENASVRGRAAESLSYTRDAGFLVKTLTGHPDPLVRRHALEALMDSPGGRRQAGRLPRREIRFTSTRTAGPELFSYFLRALEDPDEGVREYGCNAIEHSAAISGLVPVRAAVEKLRAIAEDEAASSLIRDTAAEAIESIQEASCSDFILASVKDALQWRGAIARDAHALRFDQSKGHFIIDPSAGLDAGDLSERWTRELGFAEQEVLAVQQALRNDAPLPDETAGAALKRLTRAMGAVLDLVSHASNAMRLEGEERCLAELRNWLESVKRGPALEWGPGKLAARLLRKLHRARKRAAISTVRAIETLAGTSDARALAEMAEDEDDWVKIVALTARARLEQDPTETVNRLAALCSAHGRKPQYAEAVGPAAIVMLEKGHQAAPSLMDAALTLAKSTLGAELTSRLLLACQKDEVAGALISYLSGKKLEPLSHLCMACAIRGGGHSVETLEVPERAPEGGAVEVRCAYLALKAMLEDAGAAQQLEEMLRAGKGKAGYYSALYLGLARVWSATATLAAVSDRDAHYLVRGLCASMLVRRGHGGGLNWFRKVLQGRSGLVRTRLSIEMVRAVEDTLRLMLECRDVNVGRFV